ncbi:hypothetical protein GGX14DRAFT_696606, partial [Mycena pura]
MLPTSIVLNAAGTIVNFGVQRQNAKQHVERDNQNVNLLMKAFIEGQLSAQKFEGLHEGLPKAFDFEGLRPSGEHCWPLAALPAQLGKFRTRSGIPVAAFHRVSKKRFARRLTGVTQRSFLVLTNTCPGIAIMTSASDNETLVQQIIWQDVCHLIGALFLYWDHLITLDCEVRFLCRRRKTTSAYWFFLNRYLGFISNIPIAILPFLTVPPDVRNTSFQPFLTLNLLDVPLLGLHEINLFPPNFTNRHRICGV